MKSRKFALVCLCLCWAGMGYFSLVSAQQQTQKPPAKTEPAKPAQNPEPPKPPPGPPKPKPSRVEQMSAEELKTLRAVIETQEGNITLEFFPDVAPINVRNFLRLADQGYFDGTTFGRIVKGFVIQGGNPSSWLETSPNRKIYFDTPKLKAEFSDILHERGTLSMAHPNDDPDGATVHFFVCIGRASSLDHKYTAFGKVVEGLEVVDKIAAAPLEPNTDKPSQRIEVAKIRVVYPVEAK